VFLCSIDIRGDWEGLQGQHDVCKQLERCSDDRESKKPSKWWHREVLHSAIQARRADQDRLRGKVLKREANRQGSKEARRQGGKEARADHVFPILHYELLHVHPEALFTGTVLQAKSGV
jgi:hypothetical protein